MANGVESGKKSITQTHDKNSVSEGIDEMTMDIQ